MELTPSDKIAVAWISEIILHGAPPHGGSREYQKGWNDACEKLRDLCMDGAVPGAIARIQDLVVASHPDRHGEPLVVADDQEAEWLIEHVLHCGFVVRGDAWDTDEAFEDAEDRDLARRILLRRRLFGARAIVCECERRQLAVCCREE